jgi:hypothetical protein
MKTDRLQTVQKIRINSKLSSCQNGKFLFLLVNPKKVESFKGINKIISGNVTLGNYEYLGDFKKGYMQFDKWVLELITGLEMYEVTELLRYEGYNNLSQNEDVSVVQLIRVI